MKNLSKSVSVLILAVWFLTACGDISEKVEKKLNELEAKTESLDSLINNEVDKVLKLDSLVNLENDKVKKLDSLINKTSSKLDSIAKDKVDLFEKIIN
jgi:predicted nucleotide-binding protein (sugar kinase/HSP70/actin superfamily)